MIGDLLLISSTFQLFETLPPAREQCTNLLHSRLPLRLLHHKDTPIRLNHSQEQLADEEETWDYYQSESSLILETDEPLESSESTSHTQDE